MTAIVKCPPSRGPRRLGRSALKPRRVTVATSGDHFTSIDAYLYGEWAAHRAIVGKHWTVTYLPSGRTVTPAKLTAQQAKKLARSLNALITRQEMLDWSALKLPTVAKIQDGLRAAGVSR